MPHPGPEKGYDYSDLPYKPDWKPIPDREWAIQFCKSQPGELDDEVGFQSELQRQVPGIFSGSAPSWLPSVDYFVRHDRFGRRLDVDMALAQMEKPKTILEEQKQLRDREVLEKWEEAQAALRREADTAKGEEPSSPKAQSAEKPGRTTDAREESKAIRKQLRME